MHFDRPLIKLPIEFCADTLAAEVRALPPSAWIPHPQRFPGNEAVPLVTPAGRLTNEFVGPMAPTEYLLRCKYVMEVMAEIGAVWGRSRLMGLGANAVVPEHVDNNYYWRTHIRLHIPVLTNPDVDFTCGDQTVNMAPGEAWVFDTFRKHHVHNRGSGQRVHLVFDTVGGERLWDLINAARSSAAGTNGVTPMAPGAGKRELVYEKYNYPKIMSSWELRCHISDLLELAIEAPELPAVRLRLDRLIAGWNAAWSQFETDDSGLPAYRELVTSARQDLLALGVEEVLMRNGQLLYHVLERFLFQNMMFETSAGNPAFHPRRQDAHSSAAHR